jgi:hypothetical protein
MTLSATDVTEQVPLESDAGRPVADVPKVEALDEAAPAPISPPPIPPNQRCRERRP